jgi:hypothetical protein
MKKNNTNKTALEWFAHLPEPIRSQAVSNWDKYAFEDEKEDTHNSLHGAINSFDWEETPQGDDYWDIIHSRAEAGEFDQPEPNLHGWVAIADRLPTQEDGDEFENVLIYRATTSKNQRDLSKAIIKWNMLKYSDADSTYWQPLPKLPEVKGGENA